MAGEGSMLVVKKIRKETQQKKGFPSLVTPPQQQQRPFNGL